MLFFFSKMPLSQFLLIAPALLRTSVYLALIFALNACTETETKTDREKGLIFSSSLETTYQKEDRPVFATSDTAYFLYGAEGINTTFARTGTHSLRLDSIMPYGLNCTLTPLDAYTFAEISVWVHTSNTEVYLQAAVTGKNKEKKYLTTAVETDSSSEWLLHKVTFRIEPGDESLTIGAFSGKKTAYFDDFSLGLYPTLPENDLANQLTLFIPDSNKTQLDTFINRALNSHMITPDCKQYVDGYLITPDDSASISIKLKGDLKDHLPYGKESFRIKVEDDNAYLGLRSFSIQHPKTRNFIYEWLFHKIAGREDLLTTTYDFINVNLNDNYRGIYALEEHFDKQLLESRGRREGPILKFDESAYWAVFDAFNSAKDVRFRPYFEQSPISVFKKGRTKKSKQLLGQFNEGSKLLSLFKNGKADVAAIFDIDQLAKFYALMELGGAWHAMRWHNRRFYFNPITQKLEHIAYDMLPMAEKTNFTCLMLDKLNATEQVHEMTFDNAILYNADFETAYFSYLNRFTQKAYLDSVFAEFDTSLIRYETALKKEISSYTFDKDLLYQNALFLREKMPLLKTTWGQKIREKKQYNNWIKPTDYTTENPILIKEISINAYVDQKGDSLFETQLENYHPGLLKVLGYQVKKEKKQAIWFDTPIELEAFKTKVNSATFTSSFKPKKIYFADPSEGADTLKQKVFPWPKPKGISTRMALAAQFNSGDYSIDEANKTIVFSGAVVLEQLVVVPDHFSVLIEPGTTLEFRNGGGLVVTNDVIAIGTAAEPITIFCEDATSNGFTVLKGTGSRFEHVHFAGLSNLNQQNWELTGAITIYETPVIINNCTITNNNAEDALNIVRSELRIDNLTISGAPSDGLDADFCHGLITHSRVEQTQNDGIDISGSTITLKFCTVEKVGDKGISAGEASTLILEDCQIFDAIIGIAAKDASAVKGTNVNLTSTIAGCVAFQKKPEYGNATIELNGTTISETQWPSAVQNGSVISINGKKETNRLTVPIDVLYERFQ